MHIHNNSSSGNTAVCGDIFGVMWEGNHERFASRWAPFLSPSPTVTCSVYPPPPHQQQACNYKLPAVAAVQVIVQTGSGDVFSGSSGGNSVMRQWRREGNRITPLLSPFAILPPLTQQYVGRRKKGYYPFIPPCLASPCTACCIHEQCGRCKLRVGLWGTGNFYVYTLPLHLPRYKLPIPLLHRNIFSPVVAVCPEWAMTAGDGCGCLIKHPA